MGGGGGAGDNGESREGGEGEAGGCGGAVRDVGWREAAGGGGGGGPGSSPGGPELRVCRRPPCSPRRCEADGSAMRENFDALLALGKAVLPAAGCAPVPRARRLSGVAAPTAVPSRCGSRRFPVAQRRPVPCRRSHRQTGAGAAGGGVVCRGAAGGRRGAGLRRLGWVPGRGRAAVPRRGLRGAGAAHGTRPYRVSPSEAAGAQGGGAAGGRCRWRRRHGCRAGAGARLLR